MNYTLNQSVGRLQIVDDRFLDLKCYKSLYNLDIDVIIEDILKVIPFLASKFTQKHFKKIQINLSISKISRIFISDEN